MFVMVYVGCAFIAAVPGGGTVWLLAAGAAMVAGLLILRSPWGRPVAPPITATRAVRGRAGSWILLALAIVGLVGAVLLASHDIMVGGTTCGSALWPSSRNVEYCDWDVETWRWSTVGVAYLSLLAGGFALARRFEVQGDVRRIVRRPLRLVFPLVVVLLAVIAPSVWTAQHRAALQLHLDELAERWSRETNAAYSGVTYAVWSTVSVMQDRDLTALQPLCARVNDSLADLDAALDVMPRDLDRRIGDDLAIMHDHAGRAFANCVALPPGSDWDAVKQTMQPDLRIAGAAEDRIATVVQL